jgi:hypothetical protein
MKISFKEIDDGLKNEIFLNDTFIGVVEMGLWDQKWKMTPHFTSDPFYKFDSSKKYDSAYKAGKAMAKLYSDIEYFSGQEDYLDTQEIDMRGVVSNKYAP